MSVRCQAYWLSITQAYYFNFSTHLIAAVLNGSISSRTTYSKHALI